MDELKTNVLREGARVDLDLRDEDNARFLFGEYGPEVAKEAREAAKNPMPCPPLTVSSIDYENKAVTFDMTTKQR
jgi:hypothetical protein